MKKEYMRPVLRIVKMEHAGVLMDSPDLEVDTQTQADDSETLSSGFDDSGFDRSVFVWFDE